MKRLLVLIGLIGLALGNTAWAANEGSGCGYGTYMWHGKSGLVFNLLAMTTNATFYNNLFGLTSGTAGCRADSVIMKDKEQEAFVSVNLGALNQEMAQGQGAHVAALASLMGCPTSVNGEFAQMSQESYGTVFAKEDVSANVVLSSLKEEMGRRPVLAASCARIS